MDKRIAVVGAGASGLAAGIAAAEAGERVSLLERRPKPGKKLLATGNGRCNLANTGTPLYFGQPAFAKEALRATPVADVLSAFERWGLPTLADPEGRVYPACGQASAVLAVLIGRLRALDAELWTDADVRDIRKEAGRFILTLADGRQLIADRVILATGGLAGGALGGRREDYGLAERFGHRVGALFPGLAALETGKKAVRALSGLRVPVIASLRADGKAVCRTAGEALFTDYGLSGICVMQLARDAGAQLRQGREVSVSLDLSPLMGLSARAFGRLRETPDRFQQALALLTERQKRLGDEWLTGLLPEGMKGALAGLSPVRAAKQLTDWDFPVRGVRDMAFAQITCGGADTDQVDPTTMMSRLCPGLYLTGEMLDVDGDCGGFNLQFAFSTGLTAGRSASQ